MSGNQMPGFDPSHLGSDPSHPGSDPNHPGSDSSHPGSNPGHPRTIKDALFHLADQMKLIIQDNQTIHERLSNIESRESGTCFPSPAGSTTDDIDIPCRDKPNEPSTVPVQTHFANSIEEEDEIIFSIRNWVWTLSEKEHLNKSNWPQWKSMWLRELTILGLQDHEHVKLLPFQWQQKIASQMLRNMTKDIFDVVVYCRDFASIWLILSDLEPRTVVPGSIVKTDEWVFDTGSSVHIVNDKKWIRGPTRPYTGTIQTGGGPIQPECVGSVVLNVVRRDGSVFPIQLREALVCPTFTKNVFSGQRLFACNGYLTKDQDVMILIRGSYQTATRLGANCQINFQKIEPNAGSPHPNTAYCYIEVSW